MKKNVNLPFPHFCYIFLVILIYNDHSKIFTLSISKFIVKIVRPYTDGLRYPQ
jgi:hypothetical protein